MRGRGRNVFVVRNLQWIGMLVGLLLLVRGTIDSPALGGEPQSAPAETVAERAKEAWKGGATTIALNILDEGIRDNPESLTLHKLRGDVLTVSRRSDEAIQAYQSVLARKPTAMDVRWAKWSVLVRLGRGEESIEELQGIASIDAGNPLVHLRLAQELRKLDRLEESLESYKRAVQLAPDLLSWRLGLARAYFDVLDYLNAHEEVQYVLQRVPAGSPLELPAESMLSVIYGSGKDRGRRFSRIYSPDVTDAQLKEWALLRGEAWRVFAAGRYAEAEPMYRRLLELNPRDPTAAHQLGVILMQLDRCKEALPFLQKLGEIDSSDAEYWDSVYRIGQCLVELEQWPEALIQFKVLHGTAVELEKLNQNVQLPGGTPALDRKVLERWIAEIEPHVPEKDRIPAEPASNVKKLTEKEALEMLAKMAAEVDPENTLTERASLMGRDADFSWFRFVIPARDVMRDDFQTGEHEFIPIGPEDSFPSTQREIFMVFRLVSASYDAVPLTAECFLEASEMTKEPYGLAPDKVILSMGDQSGYFVVSPPETGWRAGLYRCGLFVGERTSAATQVDEVRFRIIEPALS